MYNSGDAIIIDIHNAELRSYLMISEHSANRRLNGKLAIIMRPATYGDLSGCYRVKVDSDEGREWILHESMFKIASKQVEVLHEAMAYEL